MSLANAAEVVVRDKDGQPIIGRDANSKIDLYGREQVTFTPVLGGAGGTSGQTYSLQSGRICRVGGLVFWSVAIVLTAKGTITGNVEIQGLPYVPRQKSAGTVVALNLATTKVDVNATIEAALAPIAVFGKAAAATSGTQLVTADIANNTEVYASGCFCE